ncbi:DUF309 domain-containing protein [Macrococcoides canis]|uniref:DUF309 domain-containing protein n=1 Tax=Macrococcoides canis TaxID=1855823 RepID=A0A4R6C749_9STAP|nr:DUF309 domain-containing protein [Macrococcus canis]TDM38285.1 DUF309 domain-containing protein [Macrococcus canis]
MVQLEFSSIYHKYRFHTVLLDGAIDRVAPGRTPVLLHTLFHLYSGVVKLKTIITEYVYYFEYLRDYFECHELLEESWKNKAEFTKQDFEVGLILLATGQYHMRRGNVTGGQRSLLKAKRILKHYINSHYEHYIDIRKLISDIEKRINSSVYFPITLPVSSEIRTLLSDKGPKNSADIHENIIHKHLKRDRTEVLLARHNALYNKKPVNESPYDSHHRNKD